MYHPIPILTLPSPGPLVYLHNERKVALGGGGQNHSQAFLPVLNTSCWHELSMFLLRAVTHRTPMQVFPASAEPESHSRAGIFLGNAEGIINLSSCYFSAQPRGRLWPINQLSTEWENPGRDTMRRKIVTQKGDRPGVRPTKLGQQGGLIF